MFCIKRISVLCQENLYSIAKYVHQNTLIALKGTRKISLQICNKIDVVGLWETRNQ